MSKNQIEQPKDFIQEVREFWKTVPRGAIAELPKALPFRGVMFGSVVTTGTSDVWTQHLRVSFAPYETFSAGWPLVGTESAPNRDTLRAITMDLLGKALLLYCETQVTEIVGELAKGIEDEHAAP